MRLGHWAVLAIGIGAAACASTVGPVVSSVQVLVVLDSLGDTLRIIPVDSPGVVHKVRFSKLAAFGNHALALRGEVAAIGHGGTVLTMDISSGTQFCDQEVAPPGVTAIASLAFSELNGHVYAAIPAINAAPHFPPLACGRGELAVRGGPLAFASARSTLFVVTGTTPTTPFSWLSTTNTDQPPNGVPLPLADSIPLALPGHATGAVLASDGFLYVINAGSGIDNARLSQVNPVSRTELNVIPGFGTLPRFIATDGADRVFVASAKEGLMVYNIRTARVERDANSFIPIGNPRGLAADDLGRVYVLTAGSCTLTGFAGTVQVFGADLVSKAPITVGRCPVAVGITDIPAARYHFVDN